MEWDLSQWALSMPRPLFGFATCEVNRMVFYCGLNPATRCVGLGPLEKGSHAGQD